LQWALPLRVTEQKERAKLVRREVSQEAQAHCTDWSAIHACDNVQSPGQLFSSTSTDPSAELQFHLLFISLQCSYYRFCFPGSSNSHTKRQLLPHSQRLVTGFRHKGRASNRGSSNDWSSICSIVVQVKALQDGHRRKDCVGSSFQGDTRWQNVFRWNALISVVMSTTSVELPLKIKCISTYNDSCILAQFSMTDGGVM
jgi:hypothetical protein